MRASTVARGVRPDQAWAWWTDFREGGEDHGFARWAHPQRRVEELEPGVLQLTETGKVGPWKLLEVNVVRLERPRLRFEARNNAGTFRGTIRFLPDAEGTRIEVVWDERLVRWLRWLGPLGRFGVRAVYAWDLRRHARDLERATPRPDSS
ncbi:MAG: SRPBCC family protein [Halobacteriales archaeon]|nr:SRPBCC family protein [Halobacteriales archaeon]